MTIWLKSDDDLATMLGIFGDHRSLPDCDASDDLLRLMRVPDG